LSTLRTANMEGEFCWCWIKLSTFW
jgi:hypothetical protein